MIKEYDSFPQEVVENFNFKLTKDMFSTNPFQKILCYVENNDVVGFLLYSLIYDRIEIDQIEVQESKRKNGIGSKLLSHLISKSKNNNIKNITLEVKKDNICALSLYKKYNFKEVAQRKNYYQGIDGILMERTL